MVSVCIATYNGEKSIKEQIDSILCQLGKDDEIVVSDDHSTDGTLTVISQINDERIHVFLNENSCSGKHVKHLQISRNFFNAIRHSRGDIIFLSDQDDIWMENKVAFCLKELQTCDLVIHNGEIVNGQKEDMHTSLWPKGFRFRNFLLIPHTYMGCCMAFRRDMLNFFFPVPDKILVHDYWIGIICELCGHVRYIPQPLIKYRLHDGNNSKTSNNNTLNKIQYRIYTMWHVLLRYVWYRFCR